MIVDVARWIPAPRTLEREEALGEWARRYFRSHGPVPAAEFALWTSLPAADARTGVALARPDLATMDVDGVEYLLDPAVPDLLAAGTGRTVWHVDAAGAMDAFVSVGSGTAAADWEGQAYAFDPATNSVWAVHYRNSVSRIQIDPV